MESGLVELEIADGVATLFLNRPDKRNALNDALRADLVHGLERVARDGCVRALVLAGRGKSFCAGGDVAGMEKRLREPLGTVGFAGWRRQQQVHHAQVLLHTLSVPTIAAVHGPAAGLGADTALACDFVFAAKDAAFSWGYIKRGLIPDGGGMYFLPRRIGLAKAKELIFTGRQVAADEAVSLGIADRLCDDHVAEARAFAAEIAANSPTALALGKSILDQSFELSLEDVFAKGSAAQGICYTSEEHQASVRAFAAAAEARRAKAGA
ncbi:enoyl-CoA hydratase/isomerase family protein [Amaricoccus solimangrovi]|uniref:Enoyl-CoA hydratase/isomerase family protein n=1 Tax=Amaricoccus solimangrovi TaxID=2589815 RepID=A0A501WD11_9RHOB|nr:enoyl-CoA hydratase/isomerase family protein [Amaricoccus solimangrovi]TPE47479.1 enoyl-CoA hydratase/isomerase family protein [Amaricoccus solimangrovi]